MPVDPYELGYGGFKFWRRHELGKKLVRKLFPKITARRAERRDARKSRQQPQEIEMNKALEVLGPLVGTLAARLVPAAAAVLSDYGINVSTDASPTTTIALAVGVYVAAHVIAAVRAHKKKAQAPTQG